MTKNMQYLLIIGCSQRKVESPGVLPAMDRYDGPTYRTLRKHFPDGDLPENLDIVIISAKYGLIECEQPIENYDQRMTPERADALASTVQDALQRKIIANTDEGTHSYIYDEVFINLGKTYKRTLESFHWGLIRTLEATGGIGLKTQQMKVWLERLGRNS